MGTVSTALTEEALSRCLKRSPYMSASLISGISGRDEDEVKCSICQVQSSWPDFQDSSYRILFAPSKLFFCHGMHNCLLLIFSFLVVDKTLVFSQSGNTITRISCRVLIIRSIFLLESYEYL